MESTCITCLHIKVYSWHVFTQKYHEQYSNIHAVGTNFMFTICVQVNMIKDDGMVIHFNNPKVQASLAANTFAITGQAENKRKLAFYQFTLVCNNKPKTIYFCFWVRALLGLRTTFHKKNKIYIVFFSAILIPGISTVFSVRS